MEKIKYTVPCLFGLEGIVGNELRHMGAVEVAPENGRVHFEGTMEDLGKLEETAEFVKERSLCGLGKSAPLPVISTIKNFREEYLEHIQEHKCRAHVCTALRTYVINPEKCIGCTKCARNCPVDAISGNKKEPHTIDATKCIKCNTCIENCKFGAISVE